MVLFPAIISLRCSLELSASGHNAPWTIPPDFPPVHQPLRCLTNSYAYLTSGRLSRRLLDLCTYRSRSNSVLRWKTYASASSASSSNLHGSWCFLNFSYSSTAGFVLFCSGGFKGNSGHFRWRSGNFQEISGSLWRVTGALVITKTTGAQWEKI